MNDKGETAAVLSYSMGSKGIMLETTIQLGVIKTANDSNAKFYNKESVTAQQIFRGFAVFFLCVCDFAQL